MLQDITLGQFFPGSSVLHRMDPRMKVGLLFLLMVLIFVCDMAVSYGVLVGLTLFLIGISGIPFRTVLKSIRPLWWILIFTFLIHYLITIHNCTSTIKEIIIAIN